MNILFVCTGNTCRSSMAEGIFKHMLKNINENIHVSSSGISAIEGQSANEKAIKALKNNGIDLSGHKARQLTDDVIEDSNLILTMTSSHKRIINDYIHRRSYEMSQCLEKKIYTLKEYAYIINNENVNESNLDIADPYGMDYNDYERSMIEIETELKKIINNIDKLNI